MAEKQYDLIVVGTGPAGATAAMYGQRLGLKVVVFGDIPGGSTYMIEELGNFPGFPNGISGTQFGVQLFQQAQQEGAHCTLTRLASLTREGDLFLGTDTEKQEYSAPCAIVASGRVPRRLAVANSHLKGVHFCSMCDGPLYRGKNASLAVIGGDNVAAQHALTLSRVAEKVVLISRKEMLNVDATHHKRLNDHKNITILMGTEVIGYEGLDVVEQIVLKTPDNPHASAAVDGVFLAIGWTPNTRMLDLPVVTSPAGYLKTDDRLMTSCPGLFAAGDVRETDMWQVLTACAEGARAAKYAADFIEQVASAG